VALCQASDNKRAAIRALFFRAADGPWLEAAQPWRRKAAGGALVGGRYGAWSARAAVCRWSRAAGPLLALVALNVADASFSAAFLSAGLMSEANPLMRVAWERSPWIFLVAKFALVNVGALALWRGRRRGLTTAALLVCLAAYAVVLVYHLLLVGTAVLIRS
jgi:hypothetical protein